MVGKIVQVTTFKIQISCPNLMLSLLRKVYFTLKSLNLQL